MLLMLFSRWMWILLGKSSVLLLLEVSLKGRALPPIRYSHAGICPNDMNPNLWVDAQSTCKRECEADLVSDARFYLSAWRAAGFVGGLVCTRSPFLLQVGRHRRCAGLGVGSARIELTRDLHKIEKVWRFIG